MRIHLLHILWEGLGGAEKGVLDLTRHLDPKKYAITVAILGRGGSTTDAIDRRGVRVVEFGGKAGWDVACFARFCVFLRSNPFGIIVNHDRTFFVNFALLPMHPRPVLVYHEHGGALVAGSFKTRLFYKLYSRFYDVLIAINEDTGQRMMRAGSPPTQKLVTIENPVDAEAFKPIPEGRRGRASRDSMIVGTVARLVPQKDLQLFLAVVCILARRRSDLRFVIVGDGLLRKELEAEADVQGLDARVMFAGETDDVPKYLRSFDLFLFTSLWEPFGRTLIESLACEVPVVAALPDAGGARELLRELPGVLLVENRKPEALARAAIQLLEDPVLMRDMGQAGREYVVEHYSLKDWVKAMDSLYEQLLKRSGLW